jgi:hypothetical protein
MNELFEFTLKYPLRTHISRKDPDSIGGVKNEFNTIDKIYGNKLTGLKGAQFAAGINGIITKSQITILASINQDRQEANDANKVEKQVTEEEKQNSNRNSIRALINFAYTDKNLSDQLESLIYFIFSNNFYKDRDLVSKLTKQDIDNNISSEDLINAFIDYIIFFQLMK